MKLLYLACFTVAVCAASSVFAWDQPKDFKVDWAPCSKEIEKFCAGINKSDESAIYRCLLKNDAELTKNCDNNAHSKYEKLIGIVK